MDFLLAGLVGWLVGWAWELWELWELLIVEGCEGLLGNEEGCESFYS